MTSPVSGIVKPKHTLASTRTRQVVLHPHTELLPAPLCLLLLQAVHSYPATAEARENAVNRHTGRKVTPFQFQVYDLCAQVRITGAHSLWITISFKTILSASSLSFLNIFLLHRLLTYFCSPPPLRSLRARFRPTSTSRTP